VTPADNSPDGLLAFVASDEGAISSGRRAAGEALGS
jgi:hypothetical protein